MQIAISALTLSLKKLSDTSLFFGASHRWMGEFRRLFACVDCEVVPAARPRGVRRDDGGRGGSKPTFRHVACKPAPDLYAWRPAAVGQRLAAGAQRLAPGDSGRGNKKIHTTGLHAQRETLHS